MRELHQTTSNCSSAYSTRPTWLRTKPLIIPPGGPSGSLPTNIPTDFSSSNSLAVFLFCRGSFAGCSSTLLSSPSRTNQSQRASPHNSLCHIHPDLSPPSLSRRSVARCGVLARHGKLPDHILNARDGNGVSWIRRGRTWTRRRVRERHLPIQGGSDGRVDLLQKGVASMYIVGSIDLRWFLLAAAGRRRGSDSSWSAKNPRVRMSGFLGYTPTSSRRPKCWNEERGFDPTRSGMLQRQIGSQGADNFRSFFRRQGQIK